MRTGASHVKGDYSGFVEERTDRPGGAGAFALGREVEQSEVGRLFRRRNNGGEGLASPDQGQSLHRRDARTAARDSGPLIYGGDSFIKLKLPKAFRILGVGKGQKRYGACGVVYYPLRGIAAAINGKSANPSDLVAFP